MSQTEIQFTSTWTGTTKGKGRLNGEQLDTIITIPNYYEGNDPGTNPKELLVSAATSCYFMTLVAMLEPRKLPIINIEMRTSAVSSDKGGLKINHVPYITLSKSASNEQLDVVTRTMTAADKSCAIGNMLRKADVEINVAGKSVLSSN